MQKCFYCKSYEGVGAIIYSRGTRKMDMYISFVQSVVCFLGIIMFVFSQKSGFVLFCFFSSVLVTETRKWVILTLYLGVTSFIPRTSHISF